MKIKLDKLKKLFKKINAAGLNESAILNFTEEGVKCRVTDPSNIVMSTITFKKEGFVDYKAIGEMGFQDMSLFVKILESFKDEEVTFNIEKNSLTVEEKGSKFETRLPDTKFIDKPSINPDLTYESTLKIKLSILERAKDNLKTLGASRYRFMTDATKLRIDSGDEKKLTVNTDITNGKELKSEFGALMGNIIDTLTQEDIEVKIGQAYPLTIIEKDIDVEAEFIVAPFEE